MSHAYTDDIDLDLRSLIAVLHQRFEACLDRSVGRGTAATEPAAILEAGLKLEACALLLCAIPAPDEDALRIKVTVAAHLRLLGADTYTSAMIETALARDHDTLQDLGPVTA